MRSFQSLIDLSQKFYLLIFADADADLPDVVAAEPPSGPVIAVDSLGLESTISTELSSLRQFMNERA